MFILQAKIGLAVWIIQAKIGLAVWKSDYFVSFLLDFNVCVLLY